MLDIALWDSDSKQRLIHAECNLIRVSRVKYKHPSSAKMSTHEADNYAHTSLLALHNMENLETIAHRSTEHGAAHIVVMIRPS